MKMKLPISAKTLKQAGKVAIAVGAGAVLAQAGSELAKRGIASVRNYANGSAMNEAIVDTGAGAVLGSVGLLAYGKITSPAKAAMAAPFVYAGVGISAWAPVVAPKITGALASVFDKLLPASPAPGGHRERFPGGVAGRDVALLGPGGVAGEDIRMRRPGGVAGSDVPVHMPL